MKMLIAAIMAVSSALFPTIAMAQQSHALSAEDSEIYQETFNKCRKGTVGAALRTTVNPEIIKSAAMNLSQIMMLSPQASKARMDSRGLSPETFRLTNSSGFWLAFRDCYAGSSEARIILIKNVISLGHLTSEVAGTLASVYTLGRIGAFNSYMMKAHPVATRLALIAGVSISLNNAFNTVKKEYFSDPTPEEAAQIRIIEREMFTSVDGTIARIIELANLKVKSIDERLRDPNISAAEKKELLTQRQALITQILSIQHSAQTSKVEVPAR